MKKILLSSFAMTSLFIITACSNETETTMKKEEAAQTSKKDNNETSNTNPQDFYKELSSGNIEHIHGIGYAGNIPGISIATHSGIRVYQDGKWLETPMQKHDYMGFQATKDGFFASGHPEPGSKLKNPLGLTKSVDGGETLKTLAFYGESDFHNLAASYNNEAIYVYNERPNSKLKTGFYFSKNSGTDWESSKLDGISSTISSFAVHPDKASIIAISAKDGIHLSTDYGNTFQMFSKSEGTTALTFGNEEIIYSHTTDKKQQGLTKQLLANSEKKELQVPPLHTKEAIMYISQNPQNPSEIVFVTSEVSVFLTTDNGQTWKQIVEEGTLQFN
ncbi:F510_1955 family glycosylhydrolase [Bacillus manliponensis]|uniref:F510_1955 family glycosylhydrolase n=1 Tax=Bacillus manliponensis TaxID=574376 RepID=UPI0035164383